MLSPFGGLSGPPAGRPVRGSAQIPGRGPGEPGRGLREQGSRVEAITPDAESRAGMGVNQMDPATRVPAARAGFAQGKREATRLTFL